MVVGGTQEGRLRALVMGEIWTQGGEGQGNGMRRRGGVMERRLGKVVLESEENTGWEDKSTSVGWETGTGFEGGEGTGERRNACEGRAGEVVWKEN